MKACQRGDQSPSTEVLPSCGGHHCGQQTQGGLVLGDRGILCAQASSPWIPVSWRCPSHPSLPGEMIPPPHPGAWSQALRWGERVDSQPTLTASAFLCSCVFSPPPIWLPPSLLQELSLPRTLLLATLRSVPLNLLDCL